MLRVSEQTSRIEHVPRILYHWRKLPGSIAQLDRREGRDLGAAGRSGRRHLERIGVAAFARPNPSFPHRAIVLRAARPSLARASR